MKNFLYQNITCIFLFDKLWCFLICRSDSYGVILIGLALCIAMVLVCVENSFGDKNIAFSLVALTLCFKSFFKYLCVYFYGFLPQLLGIELYEYSVSCNGRKKCSNLSWHSFCAWILNAHKTINQRLLEHKLNLYLKMSF